MLVDPKINVCFPSSSSVGFPSAATNQFNNVLRLAWHDAKNASLIYLGRWEHSSSNGTAKNAISGIQLQWSLGYVVIIKLTSSCDSVVIGKAWLHHVIFFYTGVFEAWMQ